MFARARLAILYLIIVLAIGSASSQTVRVAAPQPLETEMPPTTPTLSPTIPLIARPAITPTTAPKLGEGWPNLDRFVKVKDSEHFAFYAELNSYALSNMDDFAGDAEGLLQEMGNTLGERLVQRVSFYLYPPAQSDFSALSFFGPFLIYEQLGARSSRTRIKAVTAHELVHHITFESLGYPRSPVHLEGLAHWASEPYWIGAEGRSFDDRVRRYLAASGGLPLAELVRNGALWKGSTQTVAYDESGSFVGYLIRAHGLERFKRVYVDANYEREYGKNLADLEKDWLASLRDR